MIIIKKLKKYGKCVFSTKNIKKGEIVNISPVLIFSRKDSKIIENTILKNYVYEYDRNRTMIALGIGSLFNHSKTPNVKAYYFKGQMYYIATKNIDSNKQLFINYGYNPLKK